MQYLDSKVSQSLRKLRNVLLVCTCICLLIGIILLIASFDDEDYLISALIVIVIAISGFVNNILLKGFQKIVETAEFQQADLLKKHEDKKSDYTNKDEKKEKIEMYSWVRKLDSNEEFRIMEIIDKDTFLCVNARNIKGIKLKKCEITKIEIEKESKSFFENSTLLSK